VHFTRSELCRTFEDRTCEIVTVTASQENIEQKPVVFLTSRVHCGETVASYFLQGMFDFLALDCE
jgi:hypothetical protein